LFSALLLFVSALFCCTLLVAFDRGEHPLTGIETIIAFMSPLVLVRPDSLGVRFYFCVELSLF